MPIIYLVNERTGNDYGSPVCYRSKGAWETLLSTDRGDYSILVCEKGVFMRHLCYWPLSPYGWRYLFPNHP